MGLVHLLSRGSEVVSSGAEQGTELTSPDVPATMGLPVKALVVPVIAPLDEDKGLGSASLVGVEDTADASSDSTIQRATVSSAELSREESSSYKRQPSRLARGSGLLHLFYLLTAWLQVCFI